ncbi:outer membrane protein transport protein [Pyxidicoccus parkwayensis]|uniref:Outer membrane protein transport protein n=1 Tax=Pyxidicoccus parkwayensis TaxID=2813578 RepID=A0ABX7P7B6_9BACT|nr:outer membrane protein transport protein [Pyxidicoccus parkwaysis]QSQ26358.1 outer membrane protein transport protein [Pyxidicoccus parkwaysis]
MKKTLSLVTLLAAGASQAAGFQIDTQSARSTGMGNASTAVLDDSSAIYSNAANILGVKTLDITVGDTGILPSLQFTPTGGTAQGQKMTLSPPPHVFVVYRPFEKAAFGLGAYTPYGARSRWVDDFVGRFKGRESSLAAYYINPTFAYQVHERIRLGVGVDVVRSTVELKRSLNFVQSEGEVHLGGGAWGVGFNAGLQAEILPGELSVGVHYRSAVSTTFKGDADFQNVPLEFQSRLVDQAVEADVKFPATLSLGLATQPLERLTLALDIQLVDWASFQSLTIRFPGNPALDNPVAKKWVAKAKYHLGAEYALTPAVQLRGGFVVDLSPSPAETLTPDLPDADRYKLTVGAGYKLGNLRADAAYQLVLLADTESKAPGIDGTYSGTAHVFGVTLGYSL